jgi:acyl-coenzyme A synthetase/AMP-(fatty) acid ligase
MQPRSALSLWESLGQMRVERDGWLWARDASVALPELASGSALGVPPDALRGRTVLVSTSDQLSAALALIEVDGIVRRLILCPPDFDSVHLPYVIATAAVDVIITDRAPTEMHDLGVEIVSCGRSIRRGAVAREPEQSTEWILFTSGTTGVPKMVVHTLATLAGAIESTGALAGPVIWATFYDIRRYGGLQVLLRALLGGGSLVLSTLGEAPADFMHRAASHHVTHITGTPSHWRRALMSSAVRAVSPSYARLSGEIADQAVIDQLQAAVPRARVAHAFASTEAGVAFEVTDGHAGFPASLLEPNDSGVSLRIEDDTLRIRSARTALRYLGRPEPLLDGEGFVDTGDVVDLRGDRYHFAGRRGGIINVGGLKIHPEEVEAVINRHPRVRMSLVTARRNPITGSVVAADVVLATSGAGGPEATLLESTKAEILASCRGTLAPHKVPASIRIVPSLEVTPSGKLGRHDA